MTKEQIEEVEAFKEQIINHTPNTTLTLENVEDIADEIYCTIEEFPFTKVETPEYEDILEYLKSQIK